MESLLAVRWGQDNIFMEIGKVINVLIKKKGLTQAEVANKIGKSTTALSQIINGAYNPNPDTLDKICKVLGVPQPILYFLTISEDDIPAEKIELYRMLAPSIKDFLLRIFGEEKNELFNQVELN
ncbi:helix-turn-helix domain-containing protein [Allomuricauda sp. SCSIO 65647]|uniref:helix-turn-helix domain-containing protein n=1 Tax=Allomuricauda sp. SCSIO 65647 TaxID=2908843 RepID=UPI001F2F24B2|nr:helix-turn-helix transcriptional regulator [Muricauda sp. SCSIO 65647]UJH67378.1 helix-turn-helix domain-containing protein [Muricauda sp. SCSIO 65647]